MKGDKYSHKLAYKSVENKRPSIFDKVQGYVLKGKVGTVSGSQSLFLDHIIYLHTGMWNINMMLACNFAFMKYRMHG